MNGFLRGDRGGRTGGQMLLAVALIFLLDGCAVMSKLFSLPAASTPEQVTARIEALESRLRKDKKADPEGALAHELALLYVHPANRAPDYGKSLAMMRTYLSLAPPGEEDLETGRLAALLEEIERLGRLLRDSETQEDVLSAQEQALLEEIERLGRLLRDSKMHEYVLSGQVQALQHGERDAKKREQELRAQIKTLQERIEKIQALELEMEKRRRPVR